MGQKKKKDSVKEETEDGGESFDEVVRALLEVPPKPKKTKPKTTVKKKKGK